MEMETVAFVWDGSVMVPLDRFRALARRQFRPGHEYPLSVWKGRSDKSHGHYFICVKKAYDNLPEEWAQEFISPTHMRKWCLIEENYCTTRQIACATPEDVEAAKEMALDKDPYAVIEIRENVVQAWFAESQDHVSMDHDRFQMSKDAVLGRLAGMIGVTVAELTRNAKENA